MKRTTSSVRSSFVLIFFLAGCAQSNPNISGQWDCPAQQGLACATIGKADARADSATPNISHAPPSLGATPGGGASSEREALLAGTVSGPPGEARVRKTEVLARVWFYPFVDGGGHYHEGGFVHVLMRPAAWKVAPDHLFPAAPDEYSSKEQANEGGAQ